MIKTAGALLVPQLKVTTAMSSPEGDDYTTYFALVLPLLDKWGLRILP